MRDIPILHWSLASSKARASPSARPGRGFRALPFTETGLRGADRPPWRSLGRAARRVADHRLYESEEAGAEFLCKPVRIDAVLAEVIAEVALVDSKHPRRFLADSARAAQRLDHDFALAAPEGAPEIKLGGGGARPRIGVRRRRDIEGSERVSRIQDERLLDHVLQLPVVAAPLICDEIRQDLPAD